MYENYNSPLCMNFKRVYFGAINLINDMGNSVVLILLFFMFDTNKSSNVIICFYNLAKETTPPKFHILHITDKYILKNFSNCKLYSLNYIY